MGEVPRSWIPHASVKVEYIDNMFADLQHGVLAFSDVSSVYNATVLTIGGPQSFVN